MTNSTSCGHIVLCSGAMRICEYIVNCSCCFCVVVSETNCVTDCIFIWAVLSSGTYHRHWVWFAVQRNRVQQWLIPHYPQDIRQHWWASGSERESRSWNSKTAVKRHRWWWRYVIVSRVRRQHLLIRGYAVLVTVTIVTGCWWWKYVGSTASSTVTLKTHGHWHIGMMLHGVLCPLACQFDFELVVEKF